MSSFLISYFRDIDLTLFHFFNSVYGQSPALDHIAGRMESAPLKGLAFMGTFGILWFQQTKSQVRQRETLVLLLIALILSVVAARVCADLLPFRVRPMFAADIGYRAPLFHLDTYFEDWSSFPSDTAALVFVMTTGFWLVSRSWGLLWLCFSIVALAARVRFGLHYPSDVLAGALIGVGVTIAINNEFARQRFALPILALEKRAPAIFYGFLLPFVYEVSTLFAFTRSIRYTILHLTYGFGT